LGGRAVVKVLIFALAVVAASGSGEVRSDDGLSTEPISSPQMRKDAFHAFNDRLREVGSSARVKECTELRWAHPGRVQTVYGGKCVLTNNRQVVMCADKAVGFFELAYDGSVPDFMDHCWG
jgi:hypothetical protein